MPFVTANLLTGIAAWVLKTSGATQSIVLERLVHQRLFTEPGMLLGYMSLLKRRFIFLSHFVVVKIFELFWSTNLLLSVPLILEYLGIFFLTFFALYEQKKGKKAVCGTENFIYRLKGIKATFCFKFLSVRIISLYR